MYYPSTKTGDDMSSGFCVSRGALKMRDWKMRDLNYRHQTAGVENAGRWRRIVNESRIVTATKYPMSTSVNFRAIHLCFSKDMMKQQRVLFMEHRVCCSVVHKTCSFIFTITLANADRSNAFTVAFRDELQKKMG